jgi:hypothetical protein
VYIANLTRRNPGMDLLWPRSGQRKPEDIRAGTVSALLEEVFNEAEPYAFLGQSIYIFNEPTTD